MPNHDPASQRAQLAEQRLKVDFDTYDVTIEELVRRVARGRIDIAPSYQRQFRWDQERQSRLIESFLLGIPVPPLFMATNKGPESQVQWEVVDGLQRLLTLVHFVGSQEARTAANITDSSLRLSALEKLDSLNDCCFEDLSADIRTTLEDRPAKVIVLNDKSDLQVRYDLFERLNTGGVALTDHEVRECVFRGPFIDFLSEMIEQPDFKKAVVLPGPRWSDGTPQEYVLRFFAFLEGYTDFVHSVKDFLNNFISSASQKPRIRFRKNVFLTTFKFLARVFPDGIRSPKGLTTVNLFEGVATGAALALASKKDLKGCRDVSWLSAPELRGFTTGATNSRPRVLGRIEFCRNKFLSLGT